MDTDPIGLARALIRCASVTPRDEGALDVLQAALEELGFTCHRLTFAEGDSPAVDNLYARLGDKPPNFCFAGHTDVVPAGETGAWSVDPFGGEIVDGRLVGRGAADMKGAIACFVAAVTRFLGERREFGGSISLLITGDEEGPAVNGTVKVLEWLDERGERLDACLVGEPTSIARLGDIVKIGRRGSLSGRLVVRGIQGHTAYPRLADNPIPPLLDMLAALLREPLDEGSDQFEPSNLEITSVDVGNPAPNVIPARAQALFNIRFNDRHTGDSLERWLRERLDAAAAGHSYQLKIAVSGGAFLGKPGRLRDIVAQSVAEVTGEHPDFNTGGGTSDARFIHTYCPVAEIGLPGRSMHGVDEHADVADLEGLTRIYAGVLERFFAAG